MQFKTLVEGHSEDRDCKINPVLLMGIGQVIEILNMVIEIMSVVVRF